MTAIVVLHDVDVDHACLNVWPSLLRLKLVDELHSLGCQILLMLAFCMLIISFVIKVLMLVRLSTLVVALLHKIAGLLLFV